MRKMTSYILWCTVTILSLLSCQDKIEDQSPVKPPKDDKYISTIVANPVIRKNFPDPSIIDDRARTGYFYAYSTQNGQSETANVVYMPIYRSKDMVNWEFVGDAFGPGRPQWVTGTRIWAPDINYIDGKYVLYYSLGDWEQPSRSACGVAVSDKPFGPFKDKGMLVDYASQGVSNSIDANFFDDGDQKYLFWGSYGKNSGIWVLPLSDDGLSIKVGAKKQKVAGNFMEGTYVHKHDGFYYLFASTGSCCEGKESTYRIVVGRSEKVTGPYLSPEGKSMIDDKYDSYIMSSSPDKSYTGTGHNAEILTDDTGQDWMMYHAYWKGNNYKGRCANIDQVLWKGGWPYFKTGHPIPNGNGPKWLKEK